MPIKVAVCDWNGSLVEYRDEKPVLEYLALGLLTRSLPFFAVKKLLKNKPEQLEMAEEIHRTLGFGLRFHPLVARRLAQAKEELETLYERGEDSKDSDFAREMLRIYNERVIRGVPMDVVDDLINTFASNRGIKQLNYDIIFAHWNARNSGWIKRSGILSTGYKGGIKAVLFCRGHSHHFDFIGANDMAQDERGRATGIRFGIWDDKGYHFRRFFEDGYPLEIATPDECVYIGDGPGDEQCFERAGYRVLSQYADPEFRKHFEDKYCRAQPTTALILDPEGRNNRAELEEFLTKA